MYPRYPQDNQWILCKALNIDMSGRPGLTIQLQVLEGEYEGKMVLDHFVTPSEAVLWLNIIQESCNRIVEVRIEVGHRHILSAYDIREADNLKVFKLINEGVI